MNQMKAGVLLSYLQMGLNSVIALAYTPIMLRLLGQSEYGVYTLAASMISYLGLLNFGLSSSYVRYFARYQSRNDQTGLAQLNGIFLTVYAAIALIAFLAGLALSSHVELLFSPKLTAGELETVRILMVILSFNMLLTFLSTVFASFLTANEQFVFQKLLNMGKTVLTPCVTVPVLLFGFRSIGLAVAATLISAAVDCSNAVFCLKRLNMRFRLRGADFRLLGEIFGYSAFIAINSIVDQVNWQVDKFILGRYQGAAATAVYGVASQLNAVYISISTSVSAVFTPRIHKIIHTPDCDRQYTALFIQVGRIQMLILGLAGSGLVFFGKPFLSMWAGQEYGESYPILLALALPMTIPLIQNLGIEIQRAKNMHRFRSLVCLTMCGFNILVSLYLGRRYSGFGCAVGTALSLLLANGLMMNWYYWKKLRLDLGLFWRQILRLVPGLCITWVFGAGLAHFCDLYAPTPFLLAAGTYTLFYCCVMWLFGMNRAEKQAVRSLLAPLTPRAKG